MGMLDHRMGRSQSSERWSQNRRQMIVVFLALLLGAQSVSTTSEQLYLDDKRNCNREYSLDVESSYVVRDVRGAGQKSGGGHFPCYLAFSASPEGGSKVCFAAQALTIQDCRFRIHFYDGLGGGELPAPSKTLDCGSNLGKVEEWCSAGGNATFWLEQRNPGVGSLADLSFSFTVTHISSPLRHVFLDEHCEQTHILDDSAIRVTSRQNNSETSAPGHCRQTFTLAPSAQGDRLMCLDFLMWPTPEKNCSYIHFYIYSGSEDSGKYDKYYNCSETPPNEWCVNNQSITIRLNRPPRGGVEPPNYIVMLDVMDRRLGGNTREGRGGSEGGSALSTVGIVIISLCLAGVVIVIIIFAFFNYQRKKNQPDEL